MAGKCWEHRCPFPIGWFINRVTEGFVYPFKNRQMIDDIPNRSLYFYPKDIIGWEVLTEAFFFGVEVDVFHRELTSPGDVRWVYVNLLEGILGKMM